MKDIKFGTGGWRAIIGDDFTCENIRKIAKGLCMMMQSTNLIDKPVVIGYDRRFLSRQAAEWFAEVLAKNEIKVLFVNRSAPTPLIMHTVKKQKLHFGVEITASHNPSNYNGIKLIVSEGRDAPIQTTNQLEYLISLIDTDVEYTNFNQALNEEKIMLVKNPFNDFIDDILDLIDTKALKERGLRVLFDPMHGSSIYPLLTVFYTARCTIDTINDNRDAYFGDLMPAPSENSLRKLRNEVLKGKYDFGIALDGDGDRLGVIDANGNYISANKILCLLYYYLVKYKGWQGPVVRNLATTHMLDKIAESFGEKCYEVPVGFKYISSKIDEVDAVLGGESSGGLTVRGHIHGKDSIYAASLFAEMLSVTNKTPSELLDELKKEYGSFVMSEDNIKFNVDLKPSIEKTLMIDKMLPDFNDKVIKVNYEDGCKVYFEDGFVICRFSGTEPLLRIMAESTNANRARQYINIFKEFLFD